MSSFNILGPSPHGSPLKGLNADGAECKALPSPFTQHPKLPHPKQYAEQQSSEEAKYDDKDLLQPQRTLVTASPVSSIQKITTGLLSRRRTATRKLLAERRSDVQS
jgi:hypothetical protein